MKFKCSDSDEQIEAKRAKLKVRADRAQAWHTAYAWWPVNLDNGQGECIWLEAYERRYQDWSSYYSCGTHPLRRRIT